MIFFGVKRRTIVTNVRTWKQKIKQPVDPTGIPNFEWRAASAGLKRPAWVVRGG